jgi:hypothetical protein
VSWQLLFGLEKENELQEGKGLLMHQYMKGKEREWNTSMTKSRRRHNLCKHAENEKSMIL